MNINWSTSQNIVLAGTGLCMCFAMSFEAAAMQVLSPSVTPGFNQRENRPAIGDEQLTPTVEPSQRLLVSMSSMLPFDVVGSELEKPLQDVARTFLTGTAGEVVEKLNQLREQKADIPPSALLMANMLYAVGKQPQGRQWLEKCVTDHPEHPVAFLAFARFSTADKRIADADAMLEKVNRLIEQGSWSDGQQKMFRVEYLDILTDIHVQRQELEKARAGLLELKEILPENDRIPVRLAQIEFDLGNVDASFQYLNDARKLNSAIRVPESVLSGWFLRKNDLESSEEWMTLASERHPEDQNAQLDHARWLLQNDQINAAMVAVQKLEKLQGDSYVVGYLKGQISFARQAYEMAEMHFENLGRQRPGDADAINMLSLSLIESEDPAKRNRALELAAMNQGLYPKSPTAIATLGWVYHRLGKNLEAETAFQGLISSNSLDAPAAFFVAKFLDEKGDHANAITLLEQALKTHDYFMYRNAARKLLVSAQEEVASLRIPNPDDDD